MNLAASYRQVNETGTALYYQPGLLLGGELDHDCNVARGIGYFLEPLLQLAPFTKNHLKIRLKGVTNNQVDPSVDCIKSASLPLLAKFLGILSAALNGFQSSPVFDQNLILSA